jgi:hypothetical protein
MTDGINERILNLVKKKTSHDPQMYNFLIGLLFWEVENPTTGRYKDHYRGKIEIFSKKEGDFDEN